MSSSPPSRSAPQVFAAPGEPPATLVEALRPTFEFLVEAERAAAGHAEVAARFERLRSALEGLQADLLWQDSAFEGRRLYDVLLSDGDGGTASLGYRQDRGTPWALLGVQRWSESHLLRVNGRPLGVGEAVFLIDFVWRDTAVLKRLVEHCLARDEIERRGLKASPEEVQAALDELRIQNGLFTPAEVEQWLVRHSVNHRWLEERAASIALVNRLREDVVGDRVAPYFEAHREEFDSVRVARVRFARREGAERFCEGVRQSAGSFWQEVERLSASGELLEADLSRRLPRSEAAGAGLGALFEVPVGAVLAPVQRRSGFDVFKVLAHVPAVPDADTSKEVVRRLFAAWLREQASRAKVEWFWGELR